MKNLKAFLPHIIAVIIFLILASVYFAPTFSGYDLTSHDAQTSVGMGKEAVDFTKRENKETLWTNSMFSGMPTYQIYVKNNSNLLYNLVSKIFIGGLGYPIALLFIAMISFYVLLICFEVKPWLGIIGAIAFAFTSINLLYIGNGHVTKVHAIAYLPGIVGSMILAYRKNLKTGAALTALFVCLHVSANHLQQTYYFLFLAFFIVLFEFYRSYKEKILAQFTKVSAILLVAAIIGVLPTMSNLIMTYTYGENTTRGKTELTIKAEDNIDKSQGLDKDYIKQYSMGYGEVWSVAVPSIKGGAAGYIGNDPKRLENVSPEYKEYVANFNTYWGEQASSGGAFYFGAIIFLLFVLGMVFIKDKLKWAFFAASILAIILSWKYSAILDMFIESFPMFNKFRDTKMMLILAQLSFPLLGILFLKEIFKNGIDKKKLNYTMLGTIGVFVLFYLLPSTFFSFFSYEEVGFFNKQLAAVSNNPGAAQQYEQLRSEIEGVRIAIFKADVLRSIFFMLAAGALIFFFVRKKIAEKYFIIALGMLVLVDIWTVDKRYLNNEKQNGRYKHYVKSEVKKVPYPVSAADQYILQNELQKNPELTTKIEKEAAEANINATSEKLMLSFVVLNANTNYRVLTIQNPFADVSVSYYHKSIGGYHGAKLKRYQDLIDFRIQNELEVFYGALKSQNPDSIEKTLQRKIPVLNMLNTRYMIVNPEAAPLTNPYALGNAWFVNEVRMVANQDEEILSLNSINPRTTAVIEKTFENTIPSDLSNDTSATIELTSYKPDHLVYKSNTQKTQVAIFSEIYYSDGWKAYIDGKEVPYFRANYALRGLQIPEGNHTIEFKFEPKTFEISKNISYAGSALLFLFVGGMFFWGTRKK